MAIQSVTKSANEIGYQKALCDEVIKLLAYKDDKWLDLTKDLRNQNCQPFQELYKIVHNCHYTPPKRIKREVKEKPGEADFETESSGDEPSVLIPLQDNVSLTAQLSPDDSPFGQAPEVEHSQSPTGIVSSSNSYLRTDLEVPHPQMYSPPASIKLEPDAEFERMVEQLRKKYNSIRVMSWYASKASEDYKEVVNKLHNYCPCLDLLGQNRDQL